MGEVREEEGEEKVMGYSLEGDCAHALGPLSGGFSLSLSLSLSQVGILGEGSAE